MITLKTEVWKHFYLKDICQITMGNKLDYSDMTSDNPKISFVGRTGENNGIVGKVDYMAGISPCKAGCMTVALGGSLGATFLHETDFYTSQNVAVLEFEEGVSIYAKLFLSLLIMNECKYKYFSFGRELNAHIKKDFVVRLPIKYNSDGTPYIDDAKQYNENGYIPDWQFMDDYIKSLPYADLI